MAYDPTVWKSGDTITSAKLNKLENGLAEASGGGTGGGVLKIGVAMDTSSTPPTVVMDKTWAEIADADFAVCPMENGDETNIAIVIGFLSEEGVYDIYVASPAISGGTIAFDNYTFSASSPTDYPKNTLG